ncbi:phosphatase PAP2 family protein [Marinicrinis lubricantis]|uniref:Phosphatase PAP2 family protein n=1 Tax=Marinicrinis lubricantis TaxID=2086470 RepID=A0ABW1ITG7_9BACL
MEWDYSLFKLINDRANDVSWLGRLFVDAANYGDIYFVLSLAVIWIFNHKISVYGVAAGVGAVLISRFVSIFYYRNRPFIDHEVNQLLPHIESNSFPSDHAAAAFAIATMLYLFSKRTGLFFLLCASIVSFARIWVGKHYPLDVICGTVIGITLSVLLFHFLEKTRWYELATGKWKSFRRNAETEVNGMR